MVTERKEKEQAEGWFLLIRGLVYGIIILFCIALALPIVSLIWGDLNGAFSSADQIPASAKSSFDAQAGSNATIWDYTFLIVYFALCAGLLGIAYVLPTDPVIVFAIILIIVILGGVTGFLANAWIDTTSGTDPYSTAAAGFPVMSFIISNYLSFTAVLGFLVLVVFYAKPNQEGAF